MKITVQKANPGQKKENPGDEHEGAYILQAPILSDFVRAVQASKAFSPQSDAIPENTLGTSGSYDADALDHLNHAGEISAYTQKATLLVGNKTDVLSEPVKITPKVVRSFLLQLAGSANIKAEELSEKLSYAAELIIPYTGWPKSNFVERLAQELSSPNNFKVLERENNLQAKDIFTPFTLSFFSEQGAIIDFLVLPRPLDGHSVASLAVAPPHMRGDLSASSAEKNNNSNLMRILDFFPGYVILIDKNYKIHFENKVFRQMFGSGLGRNCHEILRDQDQPCTSCPPSSVFTSGSLCISEWACAKLGKAFRVYSYPFEDVDGKRLMLKVGIDITASIKVKQALDLSEQRYHSIADNLNLGIAVLDKDLRISMTNRQIERWFPQTDFTGKSICDLLGMFCSRKGDCSHCPFKATFADGGNHEYEFTAQGQLRIIDRKHPEAESIQTVKQQARTARQERSYRLLSCPIKGRGGHVRATIMLLEDITERLSVMQRLQRAQQVESMATLAGGIAHEINQPLSALHLYASGLQMLLEKQEQLPANVTQERLSLIMNQADKIREIIAHMRALVMQEDAPKPGAVNFKTALEGAIGLLGTQLQSHGIELQIDLPENLWPVKAVNVQLEQVLVNILGNAMRALDGLSNANTENSENVAPPRRKLIRVRGSNNQDKNEVHIEIADTGPGLSKGLEHHIFDPFFTTNDQHQGMGLGLSITHTFIKAWGGEVGVKNNHRELGGAAFYLLLPRGVPD